MNQPARFKGVRDWLDEHIWSTGARDIPALRWVFNAGVVIWLMLLSALFAMYTGNWKRFGILLLPILLWGTYLLGPVMQGRYLYPFVWHAPVAVGRAERGGDGEDGWGAAPSPGNSHSCFQLLAISAKNLRFLDFPLLDCVAIHEKKIIYV